MRIDPQKWKGTEMKKGDVVMIGDTSYSRVVGNRNLEEHNKHLKYRKCVILELDCVFPKTSPWGGGNYNDTIVQFCETGQIMFIEERFLKLVLPTHKVMIDVEQISYAICGNIVEISDKLYQEIKRDS